MTQQRLFKATDLDGDPAYFMTMPDGTHKQVPGHEVRFEYHGETEKYFHQPATPDEESLADRLDTVENDLAEVQVDTVYATSNLKDRKRLVREVDQLRTENSYLLEQLRELNSQSESGVTVEFESRQSIEDLEKRVEELEKQNRITVSLLEAVKKDALKTARDVDMLRHRDSDYLWPYRVPHRRIVWQVTR